MNDGECIGEALGFTKYVRELFICIYLKLAHLEILDMYVCLMSFSFLFKMVSEPSQMLLLPEYI